MKLSQFFESNFRPLANLIIFKFLFCIFLFVRLILSKDHYLNIIKTYEPNTIPIFKFFNISLFSIDQVETTLYLLCFFLFSASIGFFSRISLLGACTSWFLFFGNYESYILPEGRTGDSYNHSAVFLLLIILTLSENITKADLHKVFTKKLNKDILFKSSAYFDISSIKIYIGIIYLLSFYHKMTTGFPWADGTTQQAIFFRKAIQYNNELTLELSKSFTICLLGGVATLLLESSFIWGQFVKKIKWGFVILGLVFHWINYFFMNIGFLNYFCYMYLIFLPEIFQDFSNYLKNRAKA